MFAMPGIVTNVNSLQCCFINFRALIPLHPRPDTYRAVFGAAIVAGETPGQCLKMTSPRSSIQRPHDYIYLNHYAKN